MSQRAAESRQEGGRPCGLCPHAQPCTNKQNDPCVLQKHSGERQAAGVNISCMLFDPNITSHIRGVQCVPPKAAGAREEKGHPGFPQSFAIGLSLTFKITDLLGVCDTSCEPTSVNTWSCHNLKHSHGPGLRACGSRCCTFLKPEALLAPGTSLVFFLGQNSFPSGMLCCFSVNLITSLADVSNLTAQWSGGESTVSASWIYPPWWGQEQGFIAVCYVMGDKTAGHLSPGEVDTSVSSPCRHSLGGRASILLHL